MFETILVVGLVGFGVVILAAVIGLVATLRQGKRMYRKANEEFDAHRGYRTPWRNNQSWGKDGKG